MTHRDTFFFVSKCLTIIHDKKNRDLIEKKLILGKIKWEDVLKLSTDHYVICSLYYNLKNTKLLKYVPKKLSLYMNYLAKLNKNRNYRIKEELNELNTLLLSNKVKPIFIKGTANLIRNLYSENGERMIGDIDFLVSPKDFENSIRILTRNGYFKVNSIEPPPGHRHYPRLIKRNRIAAIEIHRDLVTEKYRNEFNFGLVKNDLTKINEFFLLSYENQFITTLVSKHINDDGFFYKKISLRNAYDVYLLSKKINIQQSLSKLNKLIYPLTCLVSICGHIFGDIRSINHIKNDNTEKYLKSFNRLLVDYKKRRLIYLKIKYQLLINKLLTNLIKLIKDKRYRKWKIKKEIKKLLPLNFLK